jgi:hypothetical protein
MKMPAWPFVHSVGAVRNSCAAVWSEIDVWNRTSKGGNDTSTALDNRQHTITNHTDDDLVALLRSFESVTLTGILGNMVMIWERWSTSPENREIFLSVSGWMQNRQMWRVVSCEWRMMELLRPDTINVKSTQYHFRSEITLLWICEISSVCKQIVT